jgi:hypothetical protein
MSRIDLVPYKFSTHYTSTAVVFVIEISISVLVARDRNNSRSTHPSYHVVGLISILRYNEYLSAITSFYATKSAH